MRTRYGMSFICMVIAYFVSWVFKDAEGLNEATTLILFLVVYLSLLQSLKFVLDM